jgi:hypothetical protein
MDNIEAHMIAERALEKLLKFRPSLSPSIAEVAAVANEVRLPPGSDASQANQARVEAWLAIRKVVRTLEGNPEHSDLTAFWRRAIDLTKHWHDAIKPTSNT